MFTTHERATSNAGCECHGSVMPGRSRWSAAIFGSLASAAFVLTRRPSREVLMHPDDVKAGLHNSLRRHRKEAARRRSDRCGRVGDRR